MRENQITSRHSTTTIQSHATHRPTTAPTKNQRPTSCRPPPPPPTTTSLSLSLSVSLSHSSTNISIIIIMRNSSIADRDPCPYRIIEDIGGAFAFGAIGGGIWHFGKGAWQSPRGSRLLGAIGNTAARAPVMGGQFAVWGGLFACCDCSLSALRQKVREM
jgi:hypothetical protein